jgi:hypothetical protein
LTKLNKKGGAIGYLFFLIAFLLIWAVWLGTFLNQLGADYIANNTPNGIEIVFYSYLNLWLFIALLLGAFSYFYFGGSQ